jgi:hypothetical protein
MYQLCDAKSKLFNLRPADANSCSESHEILHLLWNPKVQNYVHKNQSLLFILPLASPIYVILLHFFKIHFTTLPPQHTQAWSGPSLFPSGFLIKTLYAIKRRIMWGRTCITEGEMRHASKILFRMPKGKRPIAAPKLIQAHKLRCMLNKQCVIWIHVA